MYVHMMESGKTYLWKHNGVPEKVWTCPYFVQIGMREGEGTTWLYELREGFEPDPNNKLAWKAIGPLQVTIDDVPLHARTPPAS